MNRYRIGTDVPFQLSVDDGVEYLDLSYCTIVKVAMYCDAQEAFAGACTWQLNAADHTRLDCIYPGERQVYTGIMRAVVIMLTPDGEKKAYDLKDIFEIVATTEEANATGGTVTSATLSAWQLPMSTLSTIVEAAINATEAATASAIAEILYYPNDEDGGINVLHIEQADGTSHDFDIKNGSTGPQGVQGPQGPQGIQGNTGSSVDYPFELVNNRTTDDATKALSAAEGKRLGDDISELEAEVATKVAISASDNDMSSYVDIEESAHTYLNRSGEVTSASSVSSYGVTDFIPVDDVTGLLASGTLNSSVACGCAVYDEDKAFLRCNTGTATAYKEIYIKREGDAYVRFTLWDSVGVEHLLYRYPLEDVENTVISGYPADKIAVNAEIGGKALVTLANNANLLDPTNIINRTGLYFSSTGGLNYAGSAGTSGVTGFVPFGSCQSLMLLGQANLTGSLRNCVYDEDFNFVRATTYNTITKGEGEVYVRFTIKTATSNKMVCDGDYTGDYVEYAKTPKINSELLALDVTVDDITPTELKFLSENICDPDTCYFGNDKYINRDTGAVGSYTSSTIGGYTDYIPIDERGLTFTPALWSGTYIGGAVYNANKQYIRSAGSTGIVRYVEGDAYVRFTLANGASAANVMVNRGTSALSYVPYAGVTKVISKDILPEFAEGSIDTYIDGVEVVMPDEVVVTQGDNLQLFYRSLVKSVNPFAFDLLATCSAGAPFPRYLQLQTAYNNNGSVGYLSPGTRDVTMRIRDNQSRLVDTKTSTIRIIPLPTTPSAPRSVLVIGASTIAGGATTAELKRRLTDTSGVELTAANINNNSYFANPKGLGLGNINFVGRQLSSAGVRQDGVSGRKMKDVATAGTNTFFTFYFTPGAPYTFIQGSVYTIGELEFTVVGSDVEAGDLECTLTSGTGTPAESGTLVLTSGEGSASVDYTSVTVQNTNPFWNGIAGKIDFQLYSENYCEGADLDIIVSHLGINDIFSPSETVGDLVDYTKAFIRAYHSDYPDGKFILSTLVLPDITGGMGSSYKGSYANTYWNIAAQYFEYNKAIFELAANEEFADFVLVCASLAEFDNEHLFLHQTVPTSNRSVQTEEIGTNALHYSTPGFTTVADSMFHVVSYALNQLNE